MKKNTIYTLSFLMLFTLFSACKSTKGCGLTSDAQKIETTTQTNTVAISK